MKNILLSLSIILGFTSTIFSQEIHESTSYDEVEIGTVVNGSLVSISAKHDSSSVEFTKNTIEITNNEDLMILTDVEFLGEDLVSNMEIQRYKCKNPSGDVVICSVTEGVLSIFNIENNLVKTLINSDKQG